MEDSMRKNLIDALIHMYQLESIGQLTAFLEGELLVLWSLSQLQNGDVTPSMISHFTKLTRGRVAAILASLRKKQYIEMVLVEEDRRKFNVYMTQTGIAFLRTKAQLAEQYFDLLITKLGQQKVEELIYLINLSVSSMKGVVQ